MPATGNKPKKDKKLFWNPGVLTVLPSKSPSRCGLVQILRGSTKKCSDAATIFNNFDFPTALAPQRGANFADLTFQKCSHHAIFQRVWLPNGSLALAWCKFCGAQLKSAPTPPQSLTILLPNRSRATAWCKFCRPDLPKVLPSYYLSTSLTSKRPSRHSLVQILRPATSKNRPTMPVFGDFGFQTALLV